MNITPIDNGKIKTYLLKDRPSKVNINSFAKRFNKGGSFNDFIKILPDYLAASDIKELSEEIIARHRKGSFIAVGMGAHVIKVGLAPILIHLMEIGLVNSIALNGAGIIHDFEISYSGKTSEDVSAEIDSGLFGMAKDTAELLNNAISEGAAENKGIGESIGRFIYNSDFKNKNLSIIARAYELGVPVTVHVTIGADIIHMHPSANGEAIGKSSLIDFKKFTSIVSKLDGGVYLNIGSAVTMPEIFLKALTLSRNLGFAVNNIVTANMDFIQHYRPNVNVLRRPTQQGGRFFSLTGHHEIMLPLLYSMLIDKL
ncbi:MAG: hypothetical protein EVJ46_00620 [Candidatus Acididesulfobacter guangdongensis]|uniref:Deoxyhypusine synthase n=1 Tax=Acididesulfobacter guangdongensis TaxID=2597225 RepID=A0A519BHP8_ACIG2|nr:MAG: hypothetical protein EVJ46_00620 [Candidatus Acididesulfobacter guangdongensis]